MTVVDLQWDDLEHDLPAPRRQGRAPAPLSRPARAPYAPDAAHLVRFWLAGPLTLLLFVPALMAGVFGAPLMLPGLCFAWRMLRSGEDDYDDFARGGFLIGLASLVISIPFGFAPLFAFGLVFGPLMAMTFRAIAGSWH